MKNIHLTASFYKINKIRRSKEVKLRDTLKHEKETLLPFRAQSISLFFISLIEGMLRFAIILTKDPETTYEVLYREKDMHAYGKEASLGGFKKYHARVRLFTATTGLVIVMTSALAGLAINFATGVYQTALAATYSWTQTNWNTLTSNTTGHPAPANWTEYAATSTSIVGGTSLSLGTLSRTAVDDGAGLSTKTDYATGGAAEGVAISADGTSVYVTNQNIAGISRYARDTTTGTLSAKTDYLTGNAPGVVTISADGTSVYVANIGASTVSMYVRNTTTGTLSAKTDYATGATPVGLVISPDGTSVYVANYGSNTVSRYIRNTTTGTLSARTDYPGGGSPWNSTISADGTSLYVVNRDATTVSMFTRNTTTGTLSAKTDYATGAGPYGVAVSADGTSVYVANVSAASVSKFTRNTTTGTLSARTDYAAGVTPYDVIISADGRSVYVPNSNAPSTLSVFSRDTTTGVLSARTAYTTGTGPHYVAVSADGTSVYVPNSGSATVSMFNRVIKGGALGFESGTNSSTMVSGTGSSASVGLSRPLSATGGTITTSGLYTIHTFTSSGTFQLGVSKDVEYLVVAGGGGGGGSNASNSSGGGGAGGYRTGTLTSLGAGSYSVTVGAGGAGVIGSSDTAGVAGSNSIFSTITSAGGGYGAGSQSSPVDYRVGGPGGSGGGGASTIGGGGAATPPGQGNNGGRYTSGFGGGGGGGAGAAPGDSPTGGAGLSSSISGAAVTYATGGNGNSSSPVSGAANTGNGGQGVSVSASNAASGSGGSGIVIVRYATPAYLTPGTFTSAVIDTGIKKEFTTLSYSTTVPANTTITIDVRAGGTATPDGTWTSWQTSVASGGSISGLGSNRYVQYRANLATSDTSVTPTLNDITLNYDVYTSGQTLTSTKFNSGTVANLMGGATWNEDATLPAGTYVTVSLRASSSATTVASTDWTTLSSASTGCSKSGTTVTCLSSALPTSMRDAMDDQWFQYMVTLGSNGGGTPTLTDVGISYVVNDLPELQNVTATQGADGTVAISYETRDPDGTSGTFTPGSVLPSFEYSTNGGSTWTPITTNITPEALTSKAVSETTWNTYTAVWNAKSALNGVFSSTTQIRVTVNDGETANNITQLETLSFILDAKDPTFGAIPLVIQATYSPALVTVSATDDSPTEMRIGRMSDLSDATWVPFASSSTITLVNEPDTVYLQLRDTKANITAITAATTPNSPGGIVIRDLSNDPTFRLFVSWGVSPVPGPGFGAYRIYRSVAGGPYELFRTITNRMDNYLLDDNSGAMLDTTLTYYYKLYVDDVDGNTSYYSPVVSDIPDGQGGTDSTPPTITGESSTTTTQGATIYWTTNELADSSVGFCLTPCTDYSSTQGVTSYVTNHEVSLTGLTPGQSYDYIVTSRDPSGNLASSTPLTFTTKPGALISNVAVIRASNTTADISWDTDIAANANVAYATNTPPGGGFESFGGLAAYLTTRKVTLQGLTPGQTYYFYVQSTDQAGNLAEDRNVVNGIKEYYKFNTSDDLSAPIITNVATGTVIDVAAVISWDTDEAADSTVEWGTTTGVYASSTLRTTYDMSHFIQIDGLTPLTLYYYRVGSTDQNGNIATSTEYTFTTAEESFGEADRVIQLITYASARQPEGVAQVLYDEAKKALQDAQAALAARTDELAQKAAELATAVKELTDIKTEIFGLRADETTDPKAILKIVSDKFSALTKSFEGDTALNLTESELTPAMRTLRELAQAVPPPVIRGAPEVVIGANTVSIAWQSDRETNSMIALAKKDDFDPAREDPYKQEFGKAEIFETDHKVTLENLLPSTEYHFQIRSNSQLGTRVRTRDYTFVTPVELPEITNASVSQQEGGRVRFTWHTNVLANSAVRYTPYVSGKPVESKGDTFGKSDYVNDHSVTLEQLKSGTTYGIELLSTDPHGNTARRDMANYTTGKDVNPPEITQVRTDITVFPGAGDKIQVIVFWGTDELSTSQVLYDEGAASEEGSEPALSTNETIDMGTKHTIVIANWKPNTVYRFRVASTDASGNRAESKDFTVKTPQQKASIIDVILNNFSSTFGWTKNIGL